MTIAPRVAGALVTVALGTGAAAAGAGVPLPPWGDPRDIALPSWARSVAPRPDDAGRPGDMRLFSEPSRTSAPRGLTAAGASLPFYGARRGPGCSGRWWLVGPLAWTCSDDAQLSAGEPYVLPSSAVGDGPSGTYYFVRSDGAGAYVSLDSAVEGGPDRDLEGGWGVGVVEERTAAGQRWGRTSHGLWIAMNDLVPARPAAFHGETVTEGRLGFAWVVTEHAKVWSAPSSKGKPQGFRERFARVDVMGHKETMARVDDGAWMLAADLAEPSVAAPPSEIVRPDQKWIDVELATQTLVAYEGPQPVYATLVSTGRGAVGSGNETPTGVHRVWVKIAASTMASAERGDQDARYSLEDVPYVQFFNGSVALHGTYWHRDFGHMRSHGCVNLAIPDARWLFAFTEPHLLSGWVATYPTPLDDATVVRVR